MNSSGIIPNLRIGPHISKLPIVQGGMGIRISLANLASAVANEGGIGVISAVCIGMDAYRSSSSKRSMEANALALRQEIRRARQMTKGILGVNIMVALSDYDLLVQTAYDEGIDIIFAGAGLPLKLPKTLSMEQVMHSSTRFVPIVSSARAAELIFKYWLKHYNHVPDGIVLEGPLAGGHLGFNQEQLDNEQYTLDEILPGVLDVAEYYTKVVERPVPVIAAGGIFTGQHIYKYIQAGAQGVQMGTRFVATEECDASRAFKEQYVACTQEDLAIIKSPVGLLGRAINNNFLRKVANGYKQKFTCPFKCLKTCNFKQAPYCIARALDSARLGNLTDGFVFAGANAYRVSSIQTVKKLMQTLDDEFISTAQCSINPSLQAVV